MSLRPFGAFLVLAVGWSGELTRLAELSDVTLCGLGGDAKGLGNSAIVGTVEGIRQCRKKL